MLRKRISLLIAVLVCLSHILLAHSMIKLPSDPFWASPLEMYESYAFAIALGLSLPAPYISGLVILLITGWGTYRITLWFLRKLIRLITRNQADAVKGG